MAMAEEGVWPAGIHSLQRSLKERTACCSLRFAPPPLHTTHKDGAFSSGMMILLMMMMMILLPHRLLNLVSLFVQQHQAASSSSRFLTVLIMKSSSSRDCCVSDGMHASCWIVAVLHIGSFCCFLNLWSFCFCSAARQCLNVAASVSRLYIVGAKMEETEVPIFLDL